MPSGGADTAPDLSDCASCRYGGDDAALNAALEAPEPMILTVLRFVGAVAEEATLGTLKDGYGCLRHGSASSCAWLGVGAAGLFLGGGVGTSLLKGSVRTKRAANATDAANGADNVLNGTRLGQQLARESADSVFTSSGRLSSGAISDSRQIIPGSRLGNRDLTQRLTSDGSDIADWGKYTTRTHQSPSGDFQVHFYMNRSTGAIDYGYDYKVILNGAR